MNERLNEFTESDVNNYCILQKHDTSFENETLITFSFGVICRIFAIDSNIFLRNILLLLLSN